MFRISHGWGHFYFITIIHYIVVGGEMSSKVGILFMKYRRLPLTLSLRAHLFFWDRNKRFGASLTLRLDIRLLDSEILDLIENVLRLYGLRLFCQSLGRLELNRPRKLCPPPLFHFWLTIGASVRITTLRIRVRTWRGWFREAAISIFVIFFVGYEYFLMDFLSLNFIICSSQGDESISVIDFTGHLYRSIKFGYCHRFWRHSIYLLLFFFRILFFALLVFVHKHTLDFFKDKGFFGL